MAFGGAYALLLSLSWCTVIRSTPGTFQFIPRVKISREAFHTFKTPSGQSLDNLIYESKRLYAGGPQGLYMLNENGNAALIQVNVPLFPECQNSPNDCGYEITVLKEGGNGNPVFMCGIKNKDRICCYVSSKYLPVNCSRLKYPTAINEPSLHVGDSLYYTVSTGNKHQSVPSGMYRETGDGHIWPLSKKNEQKYVKILANQGQGSLNGKVYFFYIEQNQNQDPEMPLWTPRISQICRADRGGSKSVLQHRWSSMLTARLYCGDEEKHLTYTELLDVIALEDVEWKNTTIYTLFKNANNLTAVCVYKMSDIIRVFMSNELKSNMDIPSSSSSVQPGECVEDSRGLTSEFLRFMESRPELTQWIKPAREPLFFSHHQYTHLQVDRVNSKKSGKNHNVLFLSLYNGNIHKILEQDSDFFIIAEYKPFKSRTRVSDMLLDSTNKKLFVSSGSELVQLDLNNCSVYKDCESCVMARDPYCSWDWNQCRAESRSAVQDVIHGYPSACKNDAPTSSEIRSSNQRDSPNIVPTDSKYFLKCARESQHASYHWEHEGRTRECIYTDQDCLLLIDSMSAKDEGVYECIASENGTNRTIVLQTLQMNSASETRMAHVALLCFLFLISVIW